MTVTSNIILNMMSIFTYWACAEREQILRAVDREEIPKHLEERFEHEEAEKAAKKKEQAEAHLYILLRVAVLDDFTRWHEADLCDFEQVRFFLHTAWMQQFQWFQLSFPGEGIQSKEDIYAQRV